MGNQSSSSTATDKILMREDLKRSRAVLEADRVKLLRLLDEESSVPQSEIDSVFKTLSEIREAIRQIDAALVNLQ